ncbi:hypothetical protein WDU94_002019 [Cyamophila willieti]
MDNEVKETQESILKSHHGLLKLHTYHAGPPPAGAEHPDLLPSKTLDICTETNTSVCPPTDRPNDPDPVCVKLAKTAGGADPKCDEDNVCSFMIKVQNIDKLVYVSHGQKSKNAMPNSTTYKTCANKLIIYSLYAPSK